MNQYTFEVYVTDKYYIKIDAKDSVSAEDKLLEMSVDEIKEESTGIKNVDVSDITLIKSEEVEEEIE
jgi:hypothetical protein